MTFSHSDPAMINGGSCALTNRKMKKAVQLNGNNKRSGLRLIALVVCVFFVAATLFSASYILARANHTHDHSGHGGSCDTCARMQSAENFLKQFSITVTMVAANVGRAFGVLFLLKFAAMRFASSTPVAMKVRLNN